MIRSKHYSNKEWTIKKAKERGFNLELVHISNRNYAFHVYDEDGHWCGMTRVYDFNNKEVKKHLRGL